LFDAEYLTLWWISLRNLIFPGSCKKLTILYWFFKIFSKEFFCFFDIFLQILSNLFFCKGPRTTFRINTCFEQALYIPDLTDQRNYKHCFILNGKLTFAQIWAKVNKSLISVSRLTSKQTLNPGSTMWTCLTYCLHLDRQFIIQLFWTNKYCKNTQKKS
jgi:hypothetical protein